MIEIKNLSKTYGAKKVLDNINLELVEAKIYGFVGKNGAGKTTLFRSIAGMEDYLGDIVSPWSLLKNHLGFLETNPRFMTHITGWEYLKLLSVARGIEKDDFEERNIFELPLNQYASTYSTGMQKKLALLGILCQKNDVFILDEPFNGVDIHSNMIILEIIKRLKLEQKTILIASHIFSTLAAVCDQIFVLDGGRIDTVVNPDQFASLESDMKDYMVGDKVDILWS